MNNNIVLKRILKIVDFTLLIAIFLINCNNINNKEYEFRKIPLEERINSVKTYRDAIRAATDSYIFETIDFGIYEQDGIVENGKEPIEWLVLDIQDEYALLCSRYIIECEKYGELKGEFLNDKINKWLNTVFYNNAFDEDEKYAIDYYTLSNDTIISRGNYINKSYYSDGTPYISNLESVAKKGIFLFDYEEWMKYLIINSYSKIGYETESTEYVNKKYGPTNRYFLSSYNDYDNSHLQVVNDRLVDRIPLNNYVGILPAMWVNYK